MREIKFRGYSIDLKRFVYGLLIEKDGVYYILEKAIGTYSYSKTRKNNVYDCLGGRFRFELHKVEKESIGQYTGLKDKNGKEIYEGDIVHWHRSKGVKDVIDKVVYDNDYLCYRIGIWGIFFKPKLNNNVEVIGNIYKNPELAKEMRC